MNNLSIIKNLRLWFAAAAVLFGLGACGGDRNSSSGGSTPPPTAQVSTKVITFSNTTPAAVRESVTEILSPVGSAKPGAALDIPDSNGAPAAPILAVNERGQILMATSASGSGELSADSTSMALVYWVIGPEPLNAKLSQVEVKARASASFGRLVTAVAAAQEQASPLTSNSSVLKELFAVVRETTTALSTTESAKVSRGALAKVVIDPSVPFSGYSAISGSFGPVPLLLTVKDVNFTSAIRLVNTTPLYWAARTEKQDGSPLAVLSPDSSFADGYGRLEGASILTSVLANIPGVNLFTREPTIDLQDLPAEGFNLRIVQNAESKTKNWETVFYRIVKFLMKSAFSSDLPQADKCYLSIANYTIQNFGAVVSEQEPTMVNLKLGLTRSLSNSTEMFKQCAPELFGPTVQAKELYKRYAAIFFPEVVALYVAYDALGETSNVLTVVAQLAAMKKYHGEPPKLFGICENKGPLGNGTIIPCLTALRFKAFIDPVSGVKNESPSFLLGAKVPYEVQGSNGDKAALLPASLKLFNGFPSVVKAGLEIPFLEATSPGTVALDISDAATDLKASLFGRVIQTATLVAERTALAVGDASRIRLVDAFGYTVFTSGAPLTWSASIPDAVSFGAGSGGFNISVNALKATTGPVVVTVRSGAQIVSEIELAPITGGNSISITSASCTQVEVQIAGNATGPVGAYISASSNPSLGFQGGSRVTSCGTWTGTKNDSLLYCQRAPNDLPTTTFTAVHTVAGIAPIVRSANALLFVSSGLLSQTIASATAPMTCGP